MVTKMIKSRSCCVSMFIIAIGTILWLVYKYQQDNIHVYQTDGPVSTLSRPHNIHSENKIAGDITVVTAYFDLRPFSKGNQNVLRTNENYLQWAQQFQYLQNPLVFYTDSRDFIRHMLGLRQQMLNVTWVHFLKITSLKSFSYIDKISEIFDSGKYQAYYPNPVRASYTCVQFAKYEILKEAAEVNTFKTKYIMWIDLGYFRNRNSTGDFYLSKPDSFNDSKVAFNLISTKRPLTFLPETIILDKLTWVGGGLVFGTRQCIIDLAIDFQRAVKHFLSLNLINTDQQILYAMYSKQGQREIQPMTELQLYKSPKENDWFYLGESMIRETPKNYIKQSLLNLL